MDVFESIRNRRSIRKYSDRLVEDEKLEKILEAARLAPSAKNKQNWKFIVVKDEITKTKLANTTPKYDFIALAPVIIAACGIGENRTMLCGQQCYAVDLSIATSFMMLEATELGLGTCWIGGFDGISAKEILELPEQAAVVALLPLGYPAETPPARPRKAFNEVVCFGKYTE